MTRCSNEEQANRVTGQDREQLPNILAKKLPKVETGDETKGEKSAGCKRERNQGTELLRC